MTDLESLLDLYPALSTDERSDVDALVAGHPALADAHADAVRLAALLDAAARAPGPAPPAPSGDGSPDAEDAVARFERLTGVRLADVGGDGDAPPGGLPSVPAPRRSVWRPRIAAAVAVLAVGYGGLAAWSASAVSERAQIAALSEVRPLDFPTLGDPSEADRRLRSALASVDDARQSWLGLFPTYDPERLDAAAAEIAAALLDLDPDSWTAHEGRLVLGRVHFYRGRDAEAVRALGPLVARGSYRGAAARRLIDAVRA